uniref:Methyltransferase FkbM domain-containing protein n=1 Tax=viral metagenome TaxID=1070528 RepID=A0A6C0HBX4_9ZZZZ
MLSIDIKYGSLYKNIDITQFVLDNCKTENYIYVPAGDVIRASIFGDPLPGRLKSIFVIEKESETVKDIHIIKDTDVLIIDLCNLIMYKELSSLPVELKLNFGLIYNVDKLIKLHNKLKIKHGNFNSELPEQMMAINHIKGNEKILEIGGNIGRNSLIISSLLTDSKNLVTLESDTEIALQLTENRDINNLQFHIENSALSLRKLIQKNWDTIVSDELLPGYKPVNTITLDQLNDKYNIEFDTLVLDCEGAFYYILLDMPEILNNINLIIMENDYHNLEHKLYIDNRLREENFEVVYSHFGGWDNTCPCYNNFFETWKKKGL